jgi:hypothetical protein
MRVSARILVPCLLVAISPPVHGRAVEIIDLGAEKEATISVPAGELEVRFESAIPGRDYHVTFDLKTDLEPKLSLPARAMTVDACLPIKTATDDLLAAKSEVEVKDLAATLRAALLAGTGCSDNLTALEPARRALAATHLTTRVEVLQRGQRLEVTVVRSDDNTTWRRVYKAPPTGEFFSTYGFNFVHNDDELFFTQAVPDEQGKFQIARKQDRSGSDLVPSIFFAWMPEQAKPRLFNYGLTAGLGFDSSEPAVFLGGIATMRHNISLVAGAVARRVARLNGRYSQDAAGNYPVIGTELSEDQLAERTYEPAAFIGIAFRFDSSPFSAEDPADDEERSEGDGPDAPTAGNPRAGQ